MTVPESTQAILLLTARFPSAGQDPARPLTPAEWGRFAAWLKERSRKPEDLLSSGGPAGPLEGWSDGQVTAERIDRLLARGPALAIALDRWLGAGLWVLTRADPDYPGRLKRLLARISPAVLFGAGNRSLLNAGGLAVVGSRNASEADLQYASELGAACSEQGHNVVSGGARGVDEAAMLGALECEGSVTGALADSLLKRCASKRYREHIRRNNLALFSSVQPEAGFLAANAMQRNRYIYCLSQAAVVVHSGGRGGTWSGANENLKKGWVPVWVKPTDDPEAGNEALVAAGARWTEATAPDVQVDALLDGGASPAPDLPLLAPAPQEGDPEAEERPDSRSGPQSSPRETASPPETPAETVVPRTGEGPEEEPADQGAPAASKSLYELFLEKMRDACSVAPRKPTELAEELDLIPAQVKAWMERAVDEGQIEKLTRPVRYRPYALSNGRD